MDEKILITGNTAKFNAIVLPGVVQDRITVFRNDNGDEYETAGVSWVQTRFSGAAPVKTQAGSVWSYGDWPNTVADPETFTDAAPTDNKVVLTTNDVSAYSAFYIMTSGGSVSVQGSLDNGATYSGDIKLEDMEGASAAARDFVTTTTAGKLYRVLCDKFTKLRILSNGVTAITGGTLLKANH